MIKFLFLLSSSFIYGQLLHRQSISAQGTSFMLNSGIVVNQTIGQQSSIGTAIGPIVFQQGFQQSYWADLINATHSENPIQVITYPNPFVDIVNFQFLNLVNENSTVLIFDILGRLLYNKEIKMVDGLFTIDLSTFPNAEYLVRLSTSNSIHYSVIIKNL